MIRTWMVDAQATCLVLRTKKELTKKFRDYVTPVLGKTRTKEIYEAVFNLDRSDTQQLFRLISSPIQKPVANVS